MELEGQLIARTTPGIPNFQSIEDGDAAETHWYLILDPPVCVDERSDSPSDFDVSLEDVSEIQLVLTEEDYLVHRGKLGKQVQASGELYGASNGHHRTPVLLSKTSIMAPARPGP